MRILSDILKLRHEAETSVATLPALMMVSEKISSSILYGTHAQRKSGAGEGFWQFREYQDTDRPQDIDWRQSAKTDTIFTKQKEWQTRQRTYIWCANSSSMEFSSRKKRYSKQACAQIISMSLALLLRQSEEQIGVFGDIKTGNSENFMQKIGDLLLNLPNKEENLPNSNEFSLPNHASFIAIGDFLSPIENIENCFATISSGKKNAIIIQVLDPVELDLNYNGRVKFKNFNGDENIVINNVTSVRDEYKKRVNSHINDIKSLCDEHGWLYVLHKTDADITDTLKHACLMIESRK